MQKRLISSVYTKQSLKAQRGFTILELTVAMATAAILMIGCISSYVFLTDTQSKTKRMTKQHRKLRGPVSLAALDIQAGGRGGLQPRNSNLYGVTDILYKALDGSDNPAGFPALEISTLISDRDGNGRLDDGDNPPSRIIWRLYDLDGDGGVVPDLGQFIWDNGVLVAVNPIARNVQAIGFAFATDNDRDGVLDQQAGVTRWAAYDADPAGQLNIQLDSNGDGVIDENDDNNLDGIIDINDGASVALGTSIPLIRIRQVKIYILVQSPDRDPGYIDRNAYVVGQTVVHPFPIGDPQRRYEFHRQVLSIGISIRNREPDLAL
jgi:type IV pilus assembly protein PilW